jgi:hypothetical protein
VTTYSWLLGDESSSDTISTEDSRGLLLWDTNGTTDTVEYSINIDWDGDGVLDGSNEAEYMTRWTCDRGRTRMIGRAGGGFEPYRVGRLVITLDNSNGRYNPWNTSGGLYGNLEPGKLMEMKVAVYSSTSTTGYETYSVFTGYTSNLTPHGWNNTVTLECEDGLGMLKRTPIYSDVNTAEDEPIAGLFSILQSESGYPFALDASTDVPSTDSYYVSEYLDSDDALSTAEYLATAALGSIACERDGTLAFHDIYDTDGSIYALNEENTLRYPEFPNPWDYKRNSVRLRARYYLVPLGLNSDFFYVSTDSPLQIGAGESLVREFNYIDGSGNRWYCGFPSTTEPLLYVSTSSTITGSTSPSSDFSVTPTYYPENVSMLFENHTAQNQYITLLQQSARADINYYFEDIDYTFGSTSSLWTDTELFINSPYSMILAYKSDYYDVMGTTDAPSTNYSNNHKNRVNKLGNLIYDYVSSDHIFPTLQMQGRPLAQFLLDVEKKVTYSSELLGSTDTYRICGLSHQSQGSVQDVLTTIYLYPVIPSST